ncbi:MAG: Holliday junction branch migration protein RuvA [Candidatus Marinimicrobia bacterium]|nr:Holliday junction branch migration protein RuvA [Candidatus Neomarinimicrobiota bacterium]|tara:strand:- start:1808 stop:2404 length:597 start_codon:yes stop_codon:yes gene_type:complete
MIESLKGILNKKDPTQVIIDVGGVRLGVHITLSTYEKLGDVNAEVELLTYLNVREDIMELYGFFDNSERLLFKLLTSVNGIGPKSALNILSGTNPNSFKKNIINGDISSLTSIPGIGAKTAKRIVIELKDKFIDGGESVALGFQLDSDEEGVIEDVIKVLLSLGYNRNSIDKAISEIATKEVLKEDLEKIIKMTLKKL